MIFLCTDICLPRFFLFLGHVSHILIFRNFLTFDSLDLFADQTSYIYSMRQILGYLRVPMTSTVEEERTNYNEGKFRFFPLGPTTKKPTFK